MIRLTLPFPPTANNMHTVARGRKIDSGTYRHWKSVAEAEVMLWRVLARPRPVDGPYNITIECDRPDRRRRDLGNLEKPVSDLLVSAGVIADDSNAQSITLRWSDKPPAKSATVSVTLEPC